MKTLFRIALVLLILVLLAAGIAYYTVTRPAFQKKLIESKLPAGSSIEFVKITPGSIEVNDLKLLLPDGTSAKFDRLRSNFSPLAAVFDNTLKMRGFEVDGLIVKLPEANIVSPQDSTLPSVTSGTSPQPPQPSSENASKPHAEEPGSPTDVLYTLGDLNWLLDIDSIALNGVLIDASRNRYSFDVKSGAIAPGMETTLESVIKLESKQALQGGLKEFASDTRLIFTQQDSGGFEKLRLESLTAGSNATGGALLSISQTLDLSINSFEQSAEFAMSFNADLPHPEVFAPELVALQGLSLQGELQGVAEGSAMILNTAEFDASSNGSQVVAVKLKQSMTIGAQQKVTGELMEVGLTNLPLAWINPWLGNGMVLTGAPLSAQIALSGEKSGALQVKTLAPLQIGPLSVSQNSQALLQEVTFRMNPVIRVEADQSIRYDLGDFQLFDRYGDVISGTISGSKAADDGSSPVSPLAGLKTEAELNLGIAELLQQPMFSGKASVMAGQARVVLNIDDSAEYPAQIQVAITGLRARDLPELRQDYRFAAQLKQASGGGYALGSNFFAGSDTQPSTRIQVAGQVNLDASPIPFKVALTSPNIKQSDLDLLLAASKASDSAMTPSTPSAPVTAPQTTTRPPIKPVNTPMSERPPWADLNGTVAINVDQLSLDSGYTLNQVTAEAVVSEALLELSNMSATLDEGHLNGSGRVAFQSNLSKAYSLASAISFIDINPAIFSKKRSGSFPVTGLFDGSFNIKGAGATLEQAVEDSQADLVITGRDGVLTAFELDDRSQLGILGAGLLGQSLNRPGITAMAQAIPYFKDMPFQSFRLELIRSEDKLVSIPELSFVGDSVRINGKGTVAASSLGEVLSQPLDVTLGLGAKGRLIDYLETLNLLGATTADDGFRNWNQNIKIGGTLDDPDTSALMDLLKRAARSALAEPKKDKAQAPAAPNSDAATLDVVAPASTPKKSKEEKLNDDIEMGLDLLNSVFGE